MVAKVYCATLLGLDCKLIDVEVDFRHGLSHFAVVGLGDKSVQESKERIVSAIKNSAVEFVPKRIIVNLAPADMPKSGPIFDLAICAGYLLATAQIQFDPAGKVFLGELALDGTVRPIKGVLALVDGLQKAGISQVFLPAENVNEAAYIQGIEIFPVRSLNELVGHFQSEQIIPAQHRSEFTAGEIIYQPDLAEVKGLLHAKRALEIAAAGGHNLLLYGVPGAGKTFLARCLPGILPAMNLAEMLEVSKLYSIGGLLPEAGLISQRPFRSPHHSATRAALIGGGSTLLPGEISLSSHGVLFLDEFPEFSLAAIEALRQPLEDKQIHLARAATRVSFPARFMLVAAMNPCRCGHWGDRQTPCTCTHQERVSYSRRISSPILDRIDIRIRVDRINQDLTSQTASEASEVVRSRVENARQIQWQRFAGMGIYINAEMSEKVMREVCRVTPDALSLLKTAIKQLQLSGRGYSRLLKVARTIADLEDSDLITNRHIAEALSYRQYGGSET